MDSAYGDLGGIDVALEVGERSVVEFVFWKQEEGLVGEWVLIEGDGNATVGGVYDHGPYPFSGLKGSFA